MIRLLGCKWIISIVATALLAGALIVQTARLNAARNSETAAVQIANQWRSSFEAMEATNAANVRTIEKMQLEAKRMDAEASHARKVNAQLTSQYEIIREGILHGAEKSNYDRTLSPVLCHTFSELRRIQGSTGPACGN